MSENGSRRGRPSIPPGHRGGIRHLSRDLGRGHGRRQRQNVFDSHLGANDYQLSVKVLKFQTLR